MKKRAVRKPLRARHEENLRFRELKEASGLTDVQCAMRLGVSPITVRSWLRGYKEVSYRKMPLPLLMLAERLIKGRP